MAKTKKKNKKPGRAGKIALGAAAALALLLACVAGFAALKANALHVRRAELTLADLPAGFDGVTLLYASDIDLCGLNTPAKSGALFQQLQSLSPDVLILGGDYTSTSLFDALNSGGQGENTAKQLAARTSFFHYIRDFSAPLGKFAIASPQDPEPQALSDLMLESGVTPLMNDRAAIQRGGETLWLVGIATENADLSAAGKLFRRDDCVVAAAYSPAVVPRMTIAEAGDSGRWFDLALCGGTHGGQLRLFGHSVLNLSREEQQYLYGWRIENGSPVLTTSGVGCEAANLRLGSAPEVWLITLRAGEALPDLR